MSTLATTNIKHPSSASNNIVLDSSGGVDLDALTVSGSAPADSVNIDASGRLLVGTSTTQGNSTVTIQQAAANSAPLALRYNSTSDAQIGIDFYRSRSSNAKVDSDDWLMRLDAYGYDGSAYRKGASIEAIIDAATSAGDMPCRLVFSTTADGASSPTERMRISSSGEVFINSTTTNPGYGGNTTPGVYFGAANYLMLSRSGGIPLYVNRPSDDGVLVDFNQAGVSEGSISVSGTTVSYNGAHLSRWSQLPDGAEREEILRGTVLSNIDEMCNWGEEDNEQLNRMKVSDVEGDKNVSGVFQCWDDDDDTYTDDFYCAMTGDFIIRIAEGTPVHRGQLLMSAGDGTAKPQGDGFVQDKTIAKVTSNHVTCTYEDGSYCVPCVLMAC